MATSEETHDEFMERARRRVQSPSRRDPYRSWHLNPADRIEKQLQEDGHRTWGFVIYRTTYDSDADWNEFLRRLQFVLRESFEFCNGTDILDLFTLTVMEDRESLDGVDSHEIRRRFMEWRAQAPAAEQQHDDADALAITPGLSPRYRFAIQVDADSLHSVVHEAPAPDAPVFSKAGWVKIIDAAWQQGAPQTLRADLGNGIMLPMLLPSSPGDRDEFPPIEGIIDKDVGWMKMPYHRAECECYDDARDRNWWVGVYRRPPAVYGVF